MFVLWLDESNFQDDPKSRELLALRAVIKCIEEYKLQKECSLGPLQKRVSELKPKGEKRPSTDAGRTYAKKPRGPGISFPRRPAGSVGSAARRPPFPGFNWQRAPAPMPSRGPAPMPSRAPLPDRYGAADRYHQPQYMKLVRFLLTVNRSAPQNHSSTPQGPWQHHTIQALIKLRMVAQEHQLQAPMQVMPAHPGRLLPAAMQTIWDLAIALRNHRFDSSPSKVLCWWCTPWKPVPQLPWDGDVTLVIFLFPRPQPWVLEV